MPSGSGCQRRTIKIVDLQHNEVDLQNNNLAILADSLSLNNTSNPFTYLLNR